LKIKPINAFLFCAALCPLLAAFAFNIPFLLFLSVGMLYLGAIYNSARDWRKGIVIVFIWLYVEDLVRKLFTESLGRQTVLFQAIKDPILLVSYLSFFYHHRKTLTKFQMPLLFLLPWIILHFLHLYISSSSSNFFILLSSLRFSLFYIPLYFLGFEFFKNANHWSSFMKLTLFIIASLTVLAVFQNLFWGELDWVLLKGLGTKTGHSSEFGQIAFTTGTFASADRFSRHAFIFFCIALGALTLKYKKINRHALIILILSTLCILLSGRRTPMVLSLGISLFFLVRKQKNWPIFLYGLLFLIYIPNTLQNILPEQMAKPLKFYQHLFTEGRWEFSNRYNEQIEGDIARGYEQGGIFGLGIGISTQGSDFFEESIYEDHGGGLEGGWGKIILETGIVGFAAFVLFIVGLLFPCFKNYRRLKPPIKDLCWALISLQFGLLLWSSKQNTLFADSSTLPLQFFFWGVAAGTLHYLSLTKQLKPKALIS